MSTRVKRSLPLRDELARLARFGVVGVAATLTHMAFAQVFLRLGAEAWLSFLLAYVPAFGLSYLGHRHFTFRQGDKSSPWKMLFVQVVGLSAGEAMLFAVASAPAISQSLSLVVSALIVPFATYFAAKLWVFRGKAEP